MKIILIGNYNKDKQESMIRFAQMLYHGYKDLNIETEVWVPREVLSKWSSSTISGIGKWFGYIDKWIIYPLILKWKIIKNRYNQQDIYFHICDHSNSLYLNFLPLNRTIITCHDVLAIRGAMGFADAYCPASRSGVILQKWILNNLYKADNLIAVSKQTLKQIKDLKPRKVTGRWKVIYIGFNGDFRPMPSNEYSFLLNGLGFNTDVPYILHVGSSLPRKNRKLLVDMLNIMQDEWNGNICFAGEAIDYELHHHINALNLGHRVISVTRPNHEALVALYSSCKAFIFPSFSEGFGWPLIEAQACGAPVVASNIEPMPEVSNGSALHADPINPQSFVTQFLKLENEIFRSEIIAKGYKNIGRFNSQLMIKNYVNFIKEIN
jgi:glycosyltransferase involved in cell wall biosynthesis